MKLKKDQDKSKRESRKFGTMNGAEALFNVKCKANRQTPISRKICRNNCQSWHNLHKTCKFGYK